MSERKVLNKYYPPDFDASKIPKLKLPRDRQYVVRLMAPFNMRCTTCGEYIYKGKKFNARKETVQNETYLGLMIFRFYIRCPRCISEITFKTDPENTDYICEKGASRNFQAHKLMEEQEQRLQKEREEEELNNPMKALENRTKESKQEMDILEKLEELRDLNARQANVDYTSLIGLTTKNAEELKAKEQQEDEDLVKSIFGPKRIQNRLSDDESGEEDAEAVSGAKTPRRKATDVLAEGVEEPPEKKQKRSWDQSVGKLSNKSSLASLVKVKKPPEHRRGTTSSNQNISLDSQPKQKPLVSENSVISKNSESCSQPERDSKKTDSSQTSRGTMDGLGSLSMLGNYSSSSGDDSD